jgi:hypothetical protein
LPGHTLPSWNDGDAKSRIVEFVNGVTNARSKDYVEVRDRIAVFDNDGTLWSEQPLYVQFVFMLEQVKAAELEQGVCFQKNEEKAGEI